MIGLHQIFLPLFFKKSSRQHSIFNIHITIRCDEDINMQILIEFLTINVQGTKDTNFNILFACPLQHSVGVKSAKQSVEQQRVLLKKS